MKRLVMAVLAVVGISAVSAVATTTTATYAATPTATPTPMSVPAGALILQSMAVTLETGISCAYTSTTLGVKVTVKNTGSTAAGAFVVDVNGSPQGVAGLGAGQTLTLWFSGYVYSGSNTATIYINNQVVHQLTQILAIPTLPPTCTPTATPTTTPTATPTPVSVGGIGIAEQPDVTALPAAAASGRDYAVYILGAVVAVAAIGAAGWYVRRKRAV